MHQRVQASTHNFLSSGWALHLDDANNYIIVMFNSHSHKSLLFKRDYMCKVKQERSKAHDILKKQRDESAKA